VAGPADRKQRKNVQRSERIRLLNFPAKFPANWRWLLALLLVFLAGLYVYLMRPEVAGLLYDDGIYLMAAKALAHGQGYRLTGIEGQPFLYKYPPLYPLCLAGLWLLNPSFPANLAWLKGFNIVLSLATLALLAWHYRRNLRLSPWLSLALVACLGLSWRFTDLSIELMSEPLYLLLSTGALLLAHHLAQRAERDSTPLSGRALLLLITLSVASFYTRSVGIVLILALGLWLWLSRERKQSAVFLAACGLSIAPWFWWSAQRPSNITSVGHFLVRSFQETYFQSFVMDLKTEYNLGELYSRGLQELLGNFSVQFFPWLEWFFRHKPTLLSESLILGLSFGLILALGRFAYRAMQEKRISPSGLYIGLYLLILPFWSFFKIYPRFILMILPFLLPYAVFIPQQFAWPDRAKKVTVWGFLSLVCASNIVHLWPHLEKPVPNTLVISPFHDVWHDYQAVFSYLRQHTPPKAVLYTDSADESYLYSLYTDRSTLDFFIQYPGNLLEKACGTNARDCLEALQQMRTEALAGVLRQKQTQYIVYNRFGTANTPANRWTIPYLLQAHPGLLAPVMQTPDGWIIVYRLQPKG